jgi:hypothetical protein
MRLTKYSCSSAHTSFAIAIQAEAAVSTGGAFVPSSSSGVKCHKMIAGAVIRFNESSRTCCHSYPVHRMNQNSFSWVTWADCKGCSRLPTKHEWRFARKHFPKLSSLDSELGVWSPFVHGLGADSRYLLPGSSIVMNRLQGPRDQRASASSMLAVLEPRGRQRGVRVRKPRSLTCNARLLLASTVACWPSGRFARTRAQHGPQRPRLQAL